MEKIKQALERAERNRLQGLNSDPHVVRPATPVAPANTAPAVRTGEDTAVADEVGPITFHTTRVAPVDPARLERHRIRMPDASDDAARAFDLAASRLVATVRAEGWSSFAITSPGAGDGKSVTALNLAIRLSMSSRRTALLVEMDLRRPCLADYLGLEVEHGIEDVLSGNATVAQAMVSPGIERLTVLPARGAVARPELLLDSDATGRLARELKARYANRIVLFDLPPILGHGDALTFLQHVDATILIAAIGHTPEPALRGAVEALGDRPLAGTILNRAEDVLSAY